MVRQEPEKRYQFKANDALVSLRSSKRACNECIGNKIPGLRRLIECIFIKE
jgi:hypothetical protein